MRRLMVSAFALLLVGGVAAAAFVAVQNGTHKPATITLSSHSSSTTAAARSAFDAAGAPMPIRPTGMTFVLSGTLPALDDARFAWKFPAVTGDVVAAVQKLATALGLSGPVDAVEGGWSVGSADGTGPTLYVAKQPGLMWNYSGGPAVMTGKGECTASSGGYDPNSPSTTLAPAPPVCTEPAKPTGVPTADEAKAKARALLDAAGIDHSDAVITTPDNGGWAAFVQVIGTLDGIQVPSLNTTITFAGQGALEYASGYLTQPVKADSYPRIGTTAGFESLKTDGVFAYFGGGPIAYASGRDVAVASGGVAASTTYASMPPATTAVIPPDSACVGVELPPNSIASTPAIAECMGTIVPATTAIAPPPDAVCVNGQYVATTIPGQPEPKPLPPCGVICETFVAVTDSTGAPVQPLCPAPTPLPAPEPVTTTINGVHETLLDVTATDGTRYLLPAYAFTDTNGGEWPVLAIDKSYVQIEPLPVPVPLTVVDGSSSTALLPAGWTTNENGCRVPVPNTGAMVSADCPQTTAAPPADGSSSGSGGTVTPKVTMVTNPNPPDTSAAPDSTTSNP